jgi:virulence-associated protein VagC
VDDRIVDVIVRPDSRRVAAVAAVLTGVREAALREADQPEVRARGD